MIGISTFIPNRNHAKFLGRCLDSILTQSVKPLDVYVLDDASTDDSCDVVRAKQDEYRKSGIPIMLVQYYEKSKDWMLALHAHYHEGKGDYIHQLSSDDFLLPGAYNLAVQGMCNGVGVVVGDWFVADESGKAFGLAKSDYPDSTRNRDLDCWVPPVQSIPLLRQLCKPKFYEGGPCAIVRKDVLLWLHSLDFHKMGSWNDSIGYSTAAWKYGIAYLTKPCGVFTIHKSGGFNDEEKRDEEKALARFRNVEEFLDLVKKEMPDVLRLALLGKVCGTLSRSNQDKVRMS